VIRVVTLISLILCSYIHGRDYHCIIFSHDSPGKKATPTEGHTWAVFVETHNNGHIKNSFNISWGPAEPWRVLQGKTEGKNDDFSTAIKQHTNNKRKICMWGPFDMPKSYFLKAQNRYHSLEAKRYKYQVFDHVSREDKKDPAINCIHSISDIGGYLNTGMMYGEKASQAVVDFLEEKQIFTRSSNTLLLRELKLDQYPAIKQK
jgi:hypothetical protein